MKNPLLFALLLFSIAAHTQTLQELNAESKKAYDTGDFQKFLSLAQQMDAMRPSHPTFNYNLACAYALNGKTDAAIQTLEKSILMNNKADFENDADLASLRQEPSYQALLRLKSGLDLPVTGSEKVISLSEKDLHPEGLAYLPKSKQWLVASIRKGKIVSFDIATGKCEDWLNEPGLLSVFAMKADNDEKYLWVSTSAMPEQQSFSKANEGKGEILKVDIKKRKIIKRFPMEGGHVFGDLVVAKNGTVYISDSQKGSIYKIEKDVMAEWLNLEKQVFNLQGITLNGRQDKLYIADYLKGILEISIYSKAMDWLDFPAGTIGKGIDGLLWHDHSLIAIQNGIKPIRIIRYSLNEAGDKITGFKTIDHNRPEFDEPAMGIIKDGAFYFFANNPWKGYDRDFSLDVTKFDYPALYKFGLR